MVGLVINKMSFESKEGDIVEGVNLTLKGENGFFIPRSEKDKSKLRFYPLSHNLFSSVEVGKVYNFTYDVNHDTGAKYIAGCKASSF